MVREPITLKQMREAKNLSQVEVASRLGICKSAMCRIEKGQRKISLERAIQLADILGCSEREIFYALGVNTASTSQ